MDFSLRCAFVHGTAAVRMKIGADRPDHATVEIESGHAYRDIVPGRRGGVSANGQPADLSVGDCDGGRRECLGLGVTAVAGVEQAERYATYVIFGAASNGVGNGRAHIRLPVRFVNQYYCDIYA
jgi:hypothetical protein